MAKSLTLSVVLAGKDILSPKLTKVSRKMDRLAKKMAGVSSVGRTMTRGITLPVIAAGAAMFKVGADFSQAMNGVADSTGATVTQLASLRSTAIGVGLGDTTKSALDAAEAMAVLSEQGFKYQQLVNALPAVLDMAVAGKMEVADAAMLLTGVLNGFGLEAESATEVTDMLAQAADNSGQSIREYAEGLAEVSSQARLADMSIQHTIAGLGLFSNVAVKGSKGGVALRNVISRLVNPDDAKMTVLARLGIGPEDLFKASGSLKSLDTLIQQLGDKGANEGDFKILFGDEVSSRVASMVLQGAEKFRKLEAGLHDSSGKARRRAQELMANDAGAWAKLANATQALLIVVGDSGAIDWITSGMKAVTGWIAGLAESDKWMLKLATTSLAVTAAAGPMLAVLGPGAKKIAWVARGLRKVAQSKGAIKLIGRLGSGLVKLKHVAKVFPLMRKGIMLAAGSVGKLLPLVRALSITLMANPIGIAVVAATALATAGYMVYKHWEPIKKFFVELKDVVVDFAVAGIGWLMDKINSFELPGWLKAAISYVGGPFIGGEAAEVIAPGPGPAVTSRNRLRAVASGPAQGGKGGDAFLKIKFEGDTKNAKVSEFRNRGLDLEIDRGAMMGAVTG